MRITALQIEAAERAAVGGLERRNRVRDDIEHIRAAAIRRQHDILRKALGADRAHDPAFLQVDERQRVGTQRGHISTAAICVHGNPDRADATAEVILAIVRGLGRCVAIDGLRHVAVRQIDHRQRVVAIAGCVKPFAVGADVEASRHIADRNHRALRQFSYRRGCGLRSGFAGGIVGGAASRQHETSGHHGSQLTQTWLSQLLRGFIMIKTITPTHRYSLFKTRSNNRIQHKLSSHLHWPALAHTGCTCLEISPQGWTFRRFSNTAGGGRSPANSYASTDIQPHALPCLRPTAKSAPCAKASCRRAPMSNADLSEAEK